MNTDLNTVLGNPEYRLCNIEPSSGSFEFIKLNRKKFDERNFTDQFYMDDPNQSGLISVPFKDILESEIQFNNTKTNFIFHSAFCGSTLLARCLNIESKALSIREPHTLFQLSAMKRANPEYAHQSEEWNLMIRAVTYFLSRGYHKDEVAIIKPSNAMNNIIPDLFNSAPSSKAVFLYSSLEQFLISNIKKGQEYVNFCSSSLGMLTTTNVPLHINEQLASVVYKDLSDLQKAAMLWLFQLSQFNYFVNVAPHEKVHQLTIDDLINEPSKTLSDCNTLFDLNFSHDEISHVVNEGPMTKHSKEKKENYNADVKAKEDQRIVSEYRSEIDSTVAWAKDIFGSAVVTAPLQK